MQILKVSSKNLKKVIKKAADVIKKGGVVICPTDTVYGLIADVKNNFAVRKIFKIKKRLYKKPLPVFVKDLKTAKSLADVNKKQEKILKNFWPARPNFLSENLGGPARPNFLSENLGGPARPNFLSENLGGPARPNFRKDSKTWEGVGKLTAVLKAKSKKFPKGILSKDKKIGLRMPKYKLLNFLLGKLNSPLAETSANISGKKASTNIKEVLRQFKNKKHQPNLVLDAGNLKKSLPSTVIDMENLKILRKGQISREEILRVAGI